MLGANQRSTQVCTAVHTRQLLHCRAYLCQLLHWEVLTAGVASTGPALVFSIPQAFPWMVNLLFSSKATVPWSLRVVRVPHSSEAFILILTFKDLTWGATHLAAVRAQSSAQRVSLCKAIYLPSLLVLLERKTVKTCKRAYKAVPSCLSVQLPLFTFPLSDVTRLPPYSMSCVDDPSPGSLLAHFSPDAPPPPRQQACSTQPHTASFLLPAWPSLARIFCPCPEHCGSTAGPRWAPKRGPETAASSQLGTSGSREANILSSFLRDQEGNGFN